MRKRNLIFPLFLGSFFITSNVDSSVIDLYENKNSNNNLLIADCGGGGGSSPAERKKKAAQQAQAKINTLKKILAKQEEAGEDTTRTKELINLNQQLIDEKADGYYEDEKESNSNKANVDRYQALIELRKKILNSKPDKNEDFFVFIDDKTAKLGDLDTVISFFDIDKMFQEGFNDYKGDYEKNRGLFDISEAQKKEFRENDNDANEYGSDAGTYILRAIAIRVYELGKKYEGIYQQTLKALKNKNLQLSPSLKDEIVAKYQKTGLYLNGLFIMANQGSALLDEESGKWFSERYNKNSQ